MRKEKISALGWYFLIGVILDLFTESAIILVSLRSTKGVTMQERSLDRPQVDFAALIVANSVDTETEIENIVAALSDKTSVHLVEPDRAAEYVQVEGRQIDVAVVEVCDNAICAQLSRHEIPVIHLASEEEYESALQHLTEAHGPDLFTKAVVVKKDHNWVDKVISLLSQLHGHVISRKILEFFNWFFAEESPHSEELRKSGTMDLIALEGAIIKNWQYLCDDVRNRIKEVYVQVNFDDPENPILSRFPPE